MEVSSSAYGDMGGSTIQSILSQRMPYLRPSEQKVASFLLYQGAQNADWTLEELAKAADVTPSAIVRMCQAIGFNGFRGFRLRWVSEQSASRVDGRPDLHVFGPTVDALYETARLLSPQDVDRAAQVICSASRVFVYGRGGSGYVARVAASSLTVLGRIAFHLDEYERDSARLPMDADTVVLVISHRGQHRALLEFVERCREKGAFSIVITSGAATALAQSADLLLLTGAPTQDDRRQLEQAPARVVQVAVIHALVHEVAAQLA